MLDTRVHRLKAGGFFFFKVKADLKRRSFVQTTFTDRALVKAN